MNIKQNGKVIGRVDRRFTDKRVFSGRDERIGYKVTTMPRKRLRLRPVRLQLSFIQWLSVIFVVSCFIVLYMDLVNRNII